MYCSNCMYWVTSCMSIIVRFIRQHDWFQWSLPRNNGKGLTYKGGTVHTFTQYFFVITCTYSYTYLSYLSILSLHIRWLKCIGFMVYHVTSFSYFLHWVCLRHTGPDRYTYLPITLQTKYRLMYGTFRLFLLVLRSVILGSRHTLTNSVVGLPSYISTFCLFPMLALQVTIVM